MKATFHSYLQKLITPTGGRLALAAALTTLSVGHVFADDDRNVVPVEDYFDVPTPSVDEYVDIGGFELRVDRTKWGVDLTPGSRGLLGRLQGKDVAIAVLEMPKSRSLSQITTDLASAKGGKVRLEHVFTSHGVRGLKVVYGERPSLFSQNVSGIRYFFANPQGRTICFETRAKTSHPDWSGANDLVLNTLSLARRARG